MIADIAKPLAVAGLVGVFQIALGDVTSGVNMDAIATSVANIGFPIVVAVYLLTQLGSKLTDISDKLTAMDKDIAALKGVRPDS